MIIQDCMQSGPRNQPVCDNIKHAVWFVCSMRRMLLLNNIGNATTRSVPRVNIPFTFLPTPPLIAPAHEKGWTSQTVCHPASEIKLVASFVLSLLPYAALRILFLMRKSHYSPFICKLIYSVILRYVSMRSTHIWHENFTVWTIWFSENVSRSRRSRSDSALHDHFRA